MLGYWQRPEETARTLRNGWLHTGDAGKIDEDGYIYMFGRISERIKSGKLDVYARMLEETISNHPAIRQVAVIGVPNKEFGEIPKAYLSLHPESKLTENKLMDYFRKHLGQFSPRAVEIVDQMPMTPTGKISKRDLKEREKPISSR
jgi:acyl-CoA synthetase (AMP-forming)/AMP-acid ligase II